MSQFSLPKCLFASTLLLLTNTSVMAGDLKVEITDIRTTGGKLQISVFDQQKAFSQTLVSQAYTNIMVPVHGGESRFTLHDVPNGRYAISILHDKNGNQKMDTNKSDMPTEGYGTSNATDKYDEPHFAQASIVLDGQDQQVKIEMFYMGVR